MLDLLAGGQLPAAGFIRQEDIPLESFLANRFGRVYRQATPDARAAREGPARLDSQTRQD